MTVGDCWGLDRLRASAYTRAGDIRHRPAFGLFDEDGLVGQDT